MIFCRRHCLWVALLTTLLKKNFQFVAFDEPMNQSRCLVFNVDILWT